MNKRIEIPASLFATYATIAFAVWRGGHLWDVWSAVVLALLAGFLPVVAATYDGRVVRATFRLSLAYVAVGFAAYSIRHYGFIPQSVLATAIALSAMVLPLSDVDFDPDMGDDEDEDEGDDPEDLEDEGGEYEDEDGKDPVAEDPAPPTNPTRPSAPATFN